MQSLCRLRELQRDPCVSLQVRGLSRATFDGNAGTRATAIFRMEGAEWVTRRLIASAYSFLPLVQLKSGEWVGGTVDTLPITAIEDVRAGGKSILESSEPLSLELFAPGNEICTFLQFPVITTGMTIEIDLIATANNPGVEAGVAGYDVRLALEGVAR